MSRDPPLLEGHVDTAGSLAMQTAADAPQTRPPSEPSEGSGSGSDEPVRLPADVLANLRRFLLPLGTRRRWPLRLFATSCTVVGMAAGYLGMQNIKRALANETPAYARLWSFMEAETLINQALVGMVATECTMVLSQAVLLAIISGTRSATVTPLALASAVRYGVGAALSACHASASASLIW